MEGYRRLSLGFKANTNFFSGHVFVLMIVFHLPDSLRYYQWILLKVIFSFQNLNSHPQPGILWASSSIEVMTTETTLPNATDRKHAVRNIINRWDLSLSRSSRREKRSKTNSAFVRHRGEMRNMTADLMDKEFSIALLVQRPFFGTLTKPSFKDSRQET